jgi:hypothetical protein
MSLQVTRWTVDYGNGRLKEVRTPHAWRQDVDVRWEGPAIYKTLIDVPFKPVKLRFHGVSYLAEVHIDGNYELTHEGLWDAFEVPLTAYRGKRIEVEVRVTKNGGEKFPVKETLSGFIPYVFHTFGGIFRPVEIVEDSDSLVQTVSPPQELTEHMRGILHWGWYPEFGHCHPTNEVIDKEIAYVKSLGFNTIKFCLWLPPHVYLERLREAGMMAWVELPLWLAKDALFGNQRIEAELDAIVRQYAHHSNIVAWTLGCELQNSPPEFRERWVRKIQALTQCKLVKDNSGGAEMYGGDPREFGTFDDFHPYGEAHFLPGMFDALSLGARTPKPVLLGETIDHDVHRDLAQIAETMPFWASAMRELNDQGVRWQYDIPKFLNANRFAHEPRDNNHAELMQRSIEKALFVRKHTVEQLRARGDINGYVLTGLRDTPISSSGILTDWARERYSPEQFRDWNAQSILFLIPSRDPRWTRGGNRPAYRDLYNFRAGEGCLIRIGVAGGAGSASAMWRLMDREGRSVVEGVCDAVTIDAAPRQIAEIFLTGIAEGAYTLHVEYGRTQNEWTVRFHAKADLSDTKLIRPDDRADGAVFSNSGSVLLVTAWDEAAAKRTADGESQVVFLESEGVKNAPYWRENVLENPMLSFEESLAVCPDRVLDITWLRDIGGVQVLENRVDTRTYAEDPYVARIGQTVFTTYRPWGGHGSQPNGLSVNIVGQALIQKLAQLALVK